jgi:hypothetical protein
MEEIMWRGFGNPYREWRWMNRGYGYPRWRGRWGYRRRPCCCLFFALPIMVAPLLFLAAWAVHLF